MPGRHDGRTRQLKRLREGCHPRTGAPLVAAALPARGALVPGRSPRVQASLARVLERQATAVETDEETVLAMAPLFGT